MQQQEIETRMAEVLRQSAGSFALNLDTESKIQDLIRDGAARMVQEGATSEADLECALDRLAAFVLELKEAARSARRKDISTPMYERVIKSVKAEPPSGWWPFSFKA